MVVKLFLIEFIRVVINALSQRALTIYRGDAGRSKLDDLRLNNYSFKKIPLHQSAVSAKALWESRVFVSACLGMGCGQIYLNELRSLFIASD